MKRRLRRRGPPGGPLFAAAAANDVWTIDFKGWFRTGDGTRVDPLTLRDACSRYLLRCQAVAHPDTEHVWPILDAAFREYGLPLRLRSDNGPPFATIGAGGLSRLSVKVIKAGRRARAHPPRQAAGERPARAAAPDAAPGHRRPAGRHPAGAAERFGKFQTTYNEERPHAALGNATPSERYAPSPRRWDGVLRAPETDADELRAVKSNGLISWHGRLVYVSEALGGEAVGLAETATAAGRCATARSCSASSSIAATG